MTAWPGCVCLPVTNNLKQESPAIADKPTQRESCQKLLQFDVRAYNVVADNTSFV